MSVRDSLIRDYDRIVEEEFGGDYLKALEMFDSIAEDRIRERLPLYYRDRKINLDQAWKAYKGTLYEYAVYRYIKYIIESKCLEYQVLKGNEIRLYKDQIAIKNWSYILPDVDLLIVKDNNVKAILSCKTSLRERLTETAFWKRELEKKDATRDIKVVFITTDKDDELRIETNRYIVQHVLDAVFITNYKKYLQLLKDYKRRYGSQENFNKLSAKIRFIEDFEKFLFTL